MGIYYNILDIIAAIVKLLDAIIMIDSQQISNNVTLNYKYVINTINRKQLPKLMHTNFDQSRI